MTTGQATVGTATGRAARIGGLAGIAYLVLSTAGYSIFEAAGLPDVDASAQDWAAYYRDNDTDIRIGITLVGLAMVPFLWYLAGLWTMLGAAEGGSRVASRVAFAGGLVYFMYFVVVLSAALAATLRAGDVDPEVTQAISDLHIVVAGPTAAGFIALYGAAAYIGYRYRAMATPLVVLLALAALSGFTSYATTTVDTGALSADGLFGWVELGGVLLGDVALVIALLRFGSRRPNAIPPSEFDETGPAPARAAGV